MKTVTPDVNLPEMERELLADWQAKRTFERSIEQRKITDKFREFTFYDGPPFANGLPHYGHLLANTIKDSVPRYWTMRGYHVERRFGWDCHGLPVEFEIEKQKGLKGRADILKMGVANFNEECRKNVLHYTEEWQKTITRLGRWVDWNDQYRTMDKNFMESVWWVFSELHKKGLVYRDFKVVPYSPRITAVLSNFEANQNYKDVQDPAVTVKFKLVSEDAYMLGWTTTPWTLVSNLALCVGPEIDYVKVRDNETNETYYLAASRLDAVYRKSKKGEAAYTVLEKMPGTALKDKAYEPLFPFFSGHKNAFRVLLDSYVSTDDGTGIVHQAPAYGEDDFRVCKQNSIELVDPVDEEGKFKTEIAPYAGQFVKDADSNIIKDLKASHRLLRHETIFHSYPFCERTDAPLIYKAIRTWYVAVEKVKDRLVANNQTINWVPEHLRDGRMGKWLENARDWAISRNRFWGTPIPIWLCDKNEQHLEVMGSVADLEKRSGQQIADLHCHFIDKPEFQFGCKSCDGKMKRIPDVFDCWFESGSMPYAQSHYPFENQDRFKARFPADFIAEGLDQTRGWFYTLAVLSAALFEKPAFKNVVVNGLVLADDGKKMSKRLKNYTSPDLLLDRFGADSVRLYMLNSSVLKAEDLRFTDQGVRDTTRAVILPLWNSYAFLSTYAQADGWKPAPDLAKGVPPKVDHELDRWIISRFQTLCRRVHEQMEFYRLYAVVPPLLDFIDELTNWYIRSSRKRFWGTDEDESETTAQTRGTGQVSVDAQQAYATLFYVLCGFTKIFAPFAPFLADRLFKNLTEGLAGIPDSVHLCDIPMADSKLVDAELEAGMDLLRRTANLGRSLRAKHQIKTRQALPSMMVITRRPEDAGAVERGRAMILNELNVKEILFTTKESEFVKLSLKPNLKTLGKRMGKQLNEMRTTLESMNSEPDKISALLATLEESGKVSLLGHDLTEEDFLIERGPKDDRLIATEKGLTVLLDTRLTPELVNEGLAREVISRVQRHRKDSGLAVSDRIRLEVEMNGGAAPQVASAVEAFRNYIAKETLSTDLKVVATLSASVKPSEPYDLEGASMRVGLAVVQ